MFMLVTLEPQVEGFQKENREFGSGCEYAIHPSQKHRRRCDSIDLLPMYCGVSHQTRSLRKR